MIRATFDANVLVSHLLNPKGARPPNRIIRAAIAQQFQLVLIETTLDEAITSIRQKPYLAARITPENATSLEVALRMTGRVIPESIDKIPSLTRDPEDDYLLAHAVIEKFDFLVTGDRDLLVIGEFEGVRIVSPAEFAVLLKNLERNHRD